MVIKRGELNPPTSVRVLQRQSVMVVSEGNVVDRIGRYVFIKALWVDSDLIIGDVRLDGVEHIVAVVTNHADLF